jgi:3-hydroxyacyl-CoA dehydrogenase/enoyl-CoA hydratase/3-hydroxybutyryl-CoA epimerase
MAHTTPQAFQLHRLDGEIWQLTFDLPGEKVNKLNRAVMTELGDLLPELERRGSLGEIGALVLRSGKKDQFIAGADITLIQSARNAEEAADLAAQGQKLLNAWEDLPFPTIMAIQGPCLGGGCEWSLASTAILMANDKSTRIGLPEVMLGIIPGMGGCVRMPRKVGLAQGLDLILSSRMLSADKAFRAGLSEAVITAEQMDSQVLAWVKQNIEALKSRRRLAREPKLGGAGGAVGSLLEHTPMGRALMLKKARDGVIQKTGGRYPAPLEVIEVLRENGAAYGDRVRGEIRAKQMDREARGFGKCAATDVSKNLIQLFFLTEAVKKSTGAGENVQAAVVRQAAALGAGVMGGGIAQLFADKGVPVRMKDLTPVALATGVQAATKLWQKQVQRKRITSRELQQRLNLIAPVLDYSGFEGTDLVVEAVIEKMDVKRSVFQELEKTVRPDCVIASNTSSLSVTKMQQGMKHPGRIAGMHFFNPVHRMPLVEVIRGAETSDEAVATVFSLSKQLGKTPIVVKDVPGFLVNRLLTPYLNEATFMVADGAPIEELDAAILAFGMPMGPMELIDEVGIDVGEKVSHILHEAYGARMEPCTMNGGVAKAGHLGKKTARGFYVYENGGKSKRLDPEVYSILGVQARRGRFSSEEMVDRCILPMINEASRALAEGVVAGPGEVDLGMIMGTGFPPFRGGLLRYADSLGAAKIVERLRELSSRVSPRFTPSAELVAMAEKGGTFYPKGP